MQKWTKEKFLEEASKYDSPGQLMRGNKSLYKSAQYHGWLKEFPFKGKGTQKRWTKEEFIIEAAKYETSGQLLKANPSLYYSAKFHGWLEEAPNLKKRILNNWTKEQFLEEAAKYKSAAEMSRENPSLHRSAIYHGWLKDYPFKEKKVDRTWTKEQFLNEAQKYDSPSQMIRANRSLYRAADKNGWLKEFNFRKRRTTKEWTKEEFWEVASMYGNPGQMQMGNHAAFKAGENHGWNEIYPFQNRGVGNNFWTYERSKTEAQKFTTRTEFRRNSPGAYTSALLHGWLDDYTWFVVKSNQRTKYVYAYEFEKEHACYVGITNNPRIRHIQHQGLGRYKGYSSVLEFAKLHDINVPEMKVLYSELTAEEAQVLEDVTRLKYIDEGWISLNKAKTGRGIGSLGAYNYKWDKDSCRKEAEKYKTKKAFHKGSSGAYTASLKNGWLQEFYPHSTQPSKQHERGYWLKYENIEAIARNYSNFNDFRRDYQYPARIASKRGWIKLLFP